MIVERKTTPVLYLPCADEVMEMRAAFGDGTYWVCVERLPGEERGELEEGELPGGAYPSRPVIEHYRRRDEIDVLVPIIAAEPPRPPAARA